MTEKFKTASYSEKKQILTLVPDKWSQKYCSEYFNVSEYLVRNARELKKCRKHISKTCKLLLKRKNFNFITNETLHLVARFYEDANFSRQMLGKKDYVSVSKAVHKQKRLILCNLRELYNAFKENIQM